MSYLSDPEFQSKIQTLIEEKKEEAKIAAQCDNPNLLLSLLVTIMKAQQVQSGQLSFEDFFEQTNKQTEKKNYKTVMTRHRNRPEPCDRTISVIMKMYYLNDEFWDIPHYDLSEWWAAEDAHIDAPNYASFLVWAETHDDFIYEGWIERVAQPHNGGHQWVHVVTRYPSTGVSLMPRD